jgi:hypothetical protein
MFRVVVATGGGSRGGTIPARIGIPKADVWEQQQEREFNESLSVNL